MSWFTAEPKSQQPACPRCKSAQFVALVKRGNAFDTFDCAKCGPVVNQRGNK